MELLMLSRQMHASEDISNCVWPSVVGNAKGLLNRYKTSGDADQIPAEFIQSGENILLSE
jgi:hypothetical protein